MRQLMNAHQGPLVVLSEGMGEDLELPVTVQELERVGDEPAAVGELSAIVARLQRAQHAKAVLSRFPAAHLRAALATRVAGLHREQG